MALRELPINIVPDKLAAFCQRHHISWLALFGSVLRDDFTPDSDVDVLVEFDPHYQPGLFALVEMQDELEGLFGRTVDLITKDNLHRVIRNRVLSEAYTLYVHNYAQINHAVIWQVVTDNLPQVIAQLEPLLPPIDEEA